MAEALKFRVMPRFANVSEEMIDAMEEIAKGTKDATEFGGTLYRRKI